MELDQDSSAANLELLIREVETVSPNLISPSGMLSLQDTQPKELTGVVSQQLNFTYWRNQGDALLEAGEWQKAIASYTQAIKFDPNDRAVLQAYCFALDRLGRHEDVIKGYERILKKRPKDALTWYNRGVALRRLQRQQEALKGETIAISNECPKNGPMHLKTQN
ncbi:tetratricopeptide repeat protein [Leptolyngbya sp. 7M]|uniref:tetratricopeptide repeat protein n=1 Tax=Leptolyngbya sp. 7M TaxID=2812896 RepID=UPI001B8B7356|nr:tetratricopeptide repeat protein [Leptolyngbya sp. 7M]QYO62960.1 tetratricopeptide repeat protein [Leptolyngbya sp. 7M]